MPEQFNPREHLITFSIDMEIIDNDPITASCITRDLIIVEANPTRTSIRYTAAHPRFPKIQRHQPPTPMRPITTKEPHIINGHKMGEIVKLEWQEEQPLGDQ